MGRAAPKFDRAPAGELAAYAAVVAYCLALLTWRGVAWSAQFGAGGPLEGRLPGLARGWLAGRRVDLSDPQWRSLRAGIPALAALFAALAAASRALHAYAAPALAARRGWRAAAAARAALRAGAGLVFVAHLHGACAFYVVAAVAANYGLARAVAGRRGGAAALWAANLGALVAARLTDGLPFAAWLGARGLGAARLARWADARRGRLRWEIGYNLTVLRMLSFGLDLHWRRRADAGAAAQQGPKQRAGEPPPPPGAAALFGGGADAGARARAAAPLPDAAADYAALEYAAYCLYPPLYLAGPVITFQDWAWQARAAAGGALDPPGKRGGGAGDAALAAARRGPGARAVAAYAARFVLDWACLEAVTHFLYFNAAARASGRLRAAGLLGAGPRGAAEVALVGWWALAFTWLKFAALWRLFRAAALAEGVDPPENMRRCFANNYDVEGFWRGWHASFNRWLVRYLYVPLGGRRRRAAAIVPAFLFVALWHDIEWRLAGWAAAVCAAFLPELGVKALAGSPRWDGARGSPAWRHGAAALAAASIAGLMAANLAGFVLGPAGVAAYARALGGDPGFVAAAAAAFFAAAQLQFEWRAREAEAEARRAAGGGGAD